MADFLQGVRAFAWDETEGIMAYAPDTGQTFGKGDIAYFHTTGKIRKLSLTAGTKLDTTNYGTTVFAGVVAGKTFIDPNDQMIYGGRIPVNSLKSRYIWMRWADGTGVPAIPDDSALGTAVTIIGGANSTEYAGTVVACPGGGTGVLDWGRVIDYKVVRDVNGNQRGWVLVRVHNSRLGDA